jgi:hypothetical protein
VHEKQLPWEHSELGGIYVLLLLLWLLLQIMFSIPIELQGIQLTLAAGWVVGWVVDWVVGWAAVGLVGVG